MRTIAELHKLAKEDPSKMTPGELKFIRAEIRRRQAAQPKPQKPARRRTKETVDIHARFADANAEYIRAKQAKDAEPSKAHVEAFHRAAGLLSRLEKDIKVLTPASGVMTRKR